MPKLNRSIIAKNVALLREKLGLSLKDFATILGTSRGTLINIEAGKTSYSLDKIKEISEFSRIPYEDFFLKSFNPSDTIRDELLLLYNKRNEYKGILSITPEFSYAFNYKLLKYGFLKQPREVREIRDYLAHEHKLIYSGSYISLSLSRLHKKNLINIMPHPTKKRTNLYWV